MKKSDISAQMRIYLAKRFIVAFPGKKNFKAIANGALQKCKIVCGRSASILLIQPEYVTKYVIMISFSRCSPL